ncbi:phosphoserine phosphatase SerB [Moraxella oblonga]|uniref:phosphoserine phosphatase SerB n=1 Tax=Moraxella oblonga TaxID=200413 RepID=UPI000832B806|nr:phosphoserine phosphatase SerB [Moraxella oblonga]
MTNVYALPNNSQAWQNALDQVAHLLPANADGKILMQLPIFAVVVVVNNQAKEAHFSVDEAVQAWVDTQIGWQIKIVYDDEVAKANAHKIETDETMSDVSVHRYLLLPTDNKEMTSQRRDAVAHIIDEQLTVYLKKQIKPACSSFGVDEHGQIIEDLPKEKRTCVDVHLLSIAQLLQTPKLVCFDMDSTLIEQEVIVELAKMCGVSDEVAHITERAMRGEIDFAQSFAQRVALLKGVSVDVVDDIIANHITFQKGAFTLIQALKAHGCHTVLVSGGFVPFAKYVATTLGIDEYYANPLLTDGDSLLGEIDTNIIDGKQKAIIVKSVARKLGLDMGQVVCVGDGANDLPMMDISNIGVAYHAKPIVQARADVAVNITGLEGVLYAMGQRFDKV